MPEEKANLDLNTEDALPETRTSIQQVRDKRQVPEGVVPKQAQGYVVAGLAVLILLAVMFSKNNTKTVPKVQATPPMAASTGANQQRIQELEQDLTADQRQSEQKEQAQAQKTDSAEMSSSARHARGGTTPAAPPVASTAPPRDPIVNAEKALSFKARFASNLVFAVGDAKQAQGKTSDSPDTPASPADDNVSPAPASTASPQQSPAVQAADTPNHTKRAAEVNIDSAHGKLYVIFEGTTIDAVLLNRLVGDFAGPVKVMVTNHIYSEDRQKVLIPAGTFILGGMQKVSGFGQKRLAVTFHRMIMPDGYSVDLDQFRGLDQPGDTGLKDKVNSHYLRIFGASIALGIIGGAAESTTYGGYTESGSDIYRQGVASSLSQSSADVLDRFINIPPTITIREGHRIKVYLTQDLLLPAYKNHTIPSDF